MLNLPRISIRPGARSIASLLASFAIAACSATSTPLPSPTAGPTSASLRDATAAPSAAGTFTTSPTLLPTPAPTPGPTAGLGLIPVPPAAAAATASRFFGGLLIADTSNSRIIVIDVAGNIVWQFPGPAGVPNGQPVDYDDAFLAPDGLSIVGNDEDHQIIDRIDIATRAVTWRYGHYNQAGSAAGYLHNPDDAYPLANGYITVADIVNCRVIQIAPSKEIVETIGTTGTCRHNPPKSYASPNGDTPLSDGGLLITEIGGSRVVRLSSTGQVLLDIAVPAKYPSDAQFDRDGNIVVADYSNPGAVLCVSPEGKLLWRYGPTSGAGRLDHPSLATPLWDGTVSINDDFRQRMLVLDPSTMTIVWQYGHTDTKGTGPGYLSKPDGHEPLPLGIFVK